MWLSDWYYPSEPDWSQRWAHKESKSSLPFSDSTHRKQCSGEGWGPLTPPAFLCRPSEALCCSVLVITKAIGCSGDGLCSCFPCLLLLALFLATYCFSQRANAWAGCLVVGTKCSDSSKASLLRLHQCLWL